MARYETILVDADSTLDEVAGEVARIVGRVARPQTDATGAAYWSIPLPAGAVGHVARADYEDDHRMPLSQYRFEVGVVDPGRDVARQESAARELYDALAASTQWPLLLTFDDLQQRVASRDVQPAAGRLQP